MLIKSHNDHDSQQKLEIKEPKTFTHPQRLHMFDGHHFRNDSESDTFCDKAIVSIPDRLAEYNFFTGMKIVDRISPLKHVIC